MTHGANQRRDGLGPKQPGRKPVATTLPLSVEYPPCGFTRLILDQPCFHEDIVSKPSDLAATPFSIVPRRTAQARSRDDAEADTTQTIDVHASVNDVGTGPVSTVSRDEEEDVTVAEYESDQQSVASQDACNRYPEGPQADEGGDSDNNSVDRAIAAMDQYLRRKVHVYLYYHDGREPESYCVHLGPWTEFSFLGTPPLNELWATLTGESVDGPRLPYQVWRPHLTDWEDVAVDTRIRVFRWDQYLVVRKLGVHTLRGFTQSIRVLTFLTQDVRTVQLSTPEMASSTSADSSQLTSPTMPSLEPLTDEDDIPPRFHRYYHMENREEFSLGLFTPPRLHSPASSEASLATTDNRGSVPPTVNDDCSSYSAIRYTRSHAPTSPSQPTSQGSSPSYEFSWPDSDETGPSNAALAALRDSPSAIELPLPTTPSRKRKRPCLNTQERLNRIPSYLAPPIDQSADSD